MTARRALWLLAIPVLALAELTLHWVFAYRAPREADWRDAVRAVDELRTSGDLVIIAPRWAEPLARAALGDSRLGLADVARADESAYARAIEIGILGRTAPELEGWRVTREQERGRFRLRVLENPRPIRPSFVFTDELTPPRAEVFDRLDAGQTPCRFNARARVSAGTLPGPPAFPAQRFECRGGGANFAGVTVIDDHEFRPRRCIWAQPALRGTRSIEFSAVPLGRVIQGYAGSPWLMLRDEVGSPVRVEVKVDGRSIGTFSHLDREGWKHFSLPTAAAGQVARVSFEVSSDRPRERQLCFHADTR
jgi:hypothetical protein